MRLRLTREAGFDEIRGCESSRTFPSNFVELKESPPPLAGFVHSGVSVLQRLRTRPRAKSFHGNRRGCQKLLDSHRMLCAASPRYFLPSPHSFGESGASFLRSRHASGITARAAEGTPIGGVAKRSTARLRAVAGASTLLGWGHGRRQNDLRRRLAALRMSAALAADGVGMEAR